MHGRRLSLVLPRKENKNKNSKFETLGNLNFNPGFLKLSIMKANNFSSMKPLDKNTK